MPQVVVVTGGNKGIGFEIARACIQAGFSVVITARDRERGEQAARALGCDLALLDLDDHSSIAACAAEVQRRYAAIDALVHNASMAFKHADRTPWTKKTRTTVSTNFFGMLAVCQNFLPLVRDGGRVVTVASSSGHLSLVPSSTLRREFASADETLTVQRLAELMTQFVLAVEESPSAAPEPAASWPHVARGWPNSAYGMSKLGQVALCKIYARELAPRGVSVSCYCPGSVATDMNPRGPRTAAQGADTAAWLLALPGRECTGQFFKDRARVAW